MSVIDTLIGAVVAALVGGPLAYFWGKKQSTDQTRYERRYEAVNEIRNRLTQIQQLFLDWTMAEYPRLDESGSRFEQSWEVVRKLDELDTYFYAQELWLEPETGQLFKRISKELDDKYLSLAKVLWANNSNPGSYDEAEAAKPIHEWAAEDAPGGLPDLKREWNQKAEQVVGNRPRWLSR
jgi:hypothetical protein